MQSQLFDVLPPFPQRRANNRDDVEAVVEVLAEFALFQQAFQVLVGRSDDAHVHFDRFSAAHAKKFPLLEDAQNLGLHAQACIADLIEEQRGEMGALEQPLLLLVRVGEGALLMAKELRLEKRLGERGAVDSQKRVGVPGAVVVNLPGHQLLARAAFAQDQDRMGRGGHFQDHPYHRFGGGRASEDGLLQRG